MFCGEKVLDKSEVSGSEAVLLDAGFPAFGAFESEVGLVASFSSCSSPCTNRGF